jgi:hypothetical protein
MNRYLLFVGLMRAVPSQAFPKPHTILPNCRPSVALVASTPRKQLSTSASAATKGSASTAKFKRNGKFYPQKKEPDFSRLPKPIRDLFEPIILMMKNAAKSTPAA